MDYVTMYPETFEAVRRYSPQDRCFLYEAMGQYAFTGELPTWAEDDLKWYVWEALKQRIDAAIRLSGSRRLSGIKGGEASASKRKQSQASESKTKQTQASTSKGNPESESESDIESDSDKEKSKRKERRFAPPTVTEVEAYIREKGYSVDADKFIAYYESNGWKVGRNPMRDWKAALRTWQANNFDRTPQKKTVVAQQYQQRDYTQDKPEPVPDWMLERWQAMQKEGTA